MASNNTMGHLLSALLVAAPLVIVSCTVKENRQLCPCYTSVDVGEFIESGHKNALVTVMSDSKSISEEINLLEYKDKPYVIPLPKGANKLSLISGMNYTHIREDSLVTPYGLSSDALWVYNEKFICKDDSYNISAVPYKNFCKMTIIVVGLVPGENYDFSFRLRAKCNALDIYDSEALEGDFCGFAIQSNTDGLFTICLPRQKSNSILLEICRSISDEEYETVHTINLNSKLTSVGYDWSKADLMDVHITVDYTSLDVSLEMINWDKDNNYIDVEI